MKNKNFHNFEIVNRWFSEEPFSCIYLQKSKMMDAFLSFATTKLIFLTNVESRIEHEEEVENDV